MFQMDIEFGDPKTNVEKMDRQFEQLTNMPDVVVLPELWTTGYDLSRLDEIADRNADQVFQTLSQWAKKYQLHIIAGSVAKQTDAGVTNTMLVVDAHGNLVKDYDKVHLFRLMNEEKYLLSGNKTGTFQLDQQPLSGVICYDIRFPEWTRTQMLDGAKVLFVVAQWPKPRIDHWRALLMSRAIENQCFVIACNRVGSDPNNTFGGQSIIVNPWGEVISEAGEEETVLYGDIDLSEVDDIRKQIPVFTDRRPSLYK
nr:carbon-nitrogen family hydrolase [Texcoconibacillus texcoconensis]